MQCECSVIILRISDSIDSWNDKPKHPIIANGANRYLTRGEIITENEIDEENLEIHEMYWEDSIITKCSKWTTYLKMFPTNPRDIESTG